ncbi:MAG: Uma2 family endonuclease [Zoogloeaceae bacterium]|nr:Uma2 family endonuclease [Zoogloeaceae bacterium]
MGHAQQKPSITEHDYLGGESLAPHRNEYVDGEIYAMTGGTARHNRIALNIAIRLDASARDSGCEVFIADMKVKVDAHRAFYYPDVMLACPHPGDDHPLYRSQPCLIVEVLSPSTAQIDAREKWLHYRDIPALRYYLLVDSERRDARIFIRAADGWLEQSLDNEDIVAIKCGALDTTLCLDDFYTRTGL